MCIVRQLITIEGIVQGVGFRPFIYRLAKQHHVKGHVANNGGVVEILAEGDSQELDTFFHQISIDAPPLSRIHTMQRKILPDSDATLQNEQNDFVIISSQATSKAARFISPDLAICEDCRKELFNVRNRRYQHIFNTCTNCGPRFSVIRALPYDRQYTTMNVFPMCNTCESEYYSPTFRRFHAETISCRDCGPRLRYIDRTTNGNTTNGNAANGISTNGNVSYGNATNSNIMYGNIALVNVIKALAAGHIIAVKGIGGYHFACSPHSAQAVRQLRLLKGRETKPFAIMFSSLALIQTYCYTNQEEEAILQSPAAPITLLPIKVNPFPEEVLCGNGRMGCFLPYTPLHLMLLEQLDMLILTSANVSGSAILFQDNELSMQDESPQQSIPTSLLGGILTHDREILRPLEDCVVQWNHKQMQFLRGGRGTAPTVFPLPPKETNASNTRKEFLALGGDLKAAFCAVKDGIAYVSQYFGDLEDEKAMEHFRQEVEAYLLLFDIHPSFILCDKHPGYHSGEYAKTFGLPIISIQHHHAHAASVMAEFQLHTDVIALCFDGTGYGEDQQIWGSEFFLYKQQTHDFTRAAHLGYTQLLGGDSSAKDAKKTALCYQYKTCNYDLQNGNQWKEEEWQQEMRAFDNRADVVCAALDHHINTALTSSMGRLFDAVSALLFICDANEYEGKCAQMLEQAATDAQTMNVSPVELNFQMKQLGEGWILDEIPVIRKLTFMREVFRNDPQTAKGAALGFHLALAKTAGEICRELGKSTGIHTVVLSGGVFQNRLLTRLLTEYLEEYGFQVYCNARSIPNDNGISLGQAYLGWVR
jgi:hydrogenase maturation protein HypF